MRAVIDTNVLVSGTIYRRGFSARIVDAMLGYAITPIVSQSLLNEFGSVMRRPHIARKYPESGGRATDVGQFLQYEAMQVTGTVIQRMLADPKDDFLLACAVEGDAEYLISGDEHLLQLGEYQGVKIVTPREFVMKVL